MAPNEKSRLSPGHALRNLAHDNSSSLWRRSKSTANMREQAAQGPSASSTSLKPSSKLERTPSKMSLFNLFSKPKVEKARGHTEVGLAVPMPPQQEQHKPLPSPPKSSLRQNPPPHTQQAQRMRTSQMFNPISIRSSSMERPTSVLEDDWQPLPLFQAYQQGIKHATVQACAFSPDALLRTQSQRRQAELLREKAGSRPDLDNIPEQKKLEKPNRRLMTNPISGPTPQLTNKVYVLISGYVVQYAGEGTFDRMPEKVLKLGNESAAFACDLIPGKHWVLQISQSASEDGIVTTAPRHSVFSRLRLQGSSAKKTATSFLLVMESAEEMESWMTTVRREIENLGGTKIGDDSSRASSSTDNVSEKISTDTSSSQYLAERNPNRRSKVTPVDSPLQSQYSDSPKIIMSEWEGDRAEKRSSVADSVSVRSRYSIGGRTSVEAPSIATTAASHDQMQLDQLRHSRHSYISATSASGTGTVDTSRDSSPASTSPLKEGFPPADAEPLRSATSLKSFHMSTNRRRSMQPLPVTNEDTSLSAATDSTSQRHSAYSSTSRADHTSAPNVNVSAPAPSISITPTTRPARYSAIPTGRPYNPPNLIRYSTRSSSAPPSRISTTATPPPKEPAPAPPSAARPPSTLGNLPSSTTLSNHSERRISSNPKPYIRPFPVRPQSQTNKDGSVVVPRRFSSLGSSGPAPLPLGIVINRSATAPLQPSTSAMNARPQPPSNHTLQNQQSAQQLRRPNSVQIRSSTAPFLSQSRPARAISTTPSFVPGKRSSVAPTGLTAPATHTLSSTPSVPVLRGQGQQLSPPKTVAPRRSVPNMLPPPAPPPNMPLPLLPGPPSGESQRAVPV